MFCDVCNAVSVCKLRTVENPFTSYQLTHIAIQEMLNMNQPKLAKRYHVLFSALPVLAAGYMMPASTATDTTAAPAQIADY